MKRIVFLVLIFFNAVFAQEDVKKVVIDLRTGDIKKFEGLINGIAKNIEYYRTNLEDLKVVIVAHGDSYKFFLKNLSKTPYKNDKILLKKQKLIYKRLKSLNKYYGVKFEICQLGMQARGLDLSNLYDFVKPVYSALVGIVNWQNKGYAYIIVY